MAADTPEDRLQNFCRSRVEQSEFGAWFPEYLSDFASLGRGESQPGDVVGYYGVPSSFSRRRADDTEINAMSVTYVIAREADERLRISARRGLRAGWVRAVSPRS